jgi:NADH:ubiquinone oxidoreductase subunit 6 (subunit J)
LLKILIVVLLIGVIISLFSGLVFLFKDAEKPDSRRTLHALGIRITLATALLLAVFYGFYTGQLRLGTNAPWHIENAEAPSETPPE